MTDSSVTNENAQTAQNIPQKADKMKTIRGIATSVIINGACPFIVYTIMKNYVHASEITSILASGIPAMLDAIIGVVRKGRVDFLGGFVLISIVVGLIPYFVAGSAQLLLVRESLITGAFGLAYLVSLLLPRPLGFYFARYFVTGNNAQNIANFNNLWQYHGFRYAMRLTTIVWGVMFTLEAIIRIYLVYHLSTAQFLAVSPFVFYGFFGAVMVWTFWYSARGRQREQARQDAQ